MAGDHRGACRVANKSGNMAAVYGKNEDHGVHDYSPSGYNFGGPGLPATTNAHDSRYHGVSPLWTPGKPCPVPGCGATISGNHMRRHWNEKHRPVIWKHHCALCSYTAKRRSKLLEHIRYRHRDVMFADPVHGVDKAIGKVDFHTNDQFIDAGSLTYESITGYCIKYH